MSYEAGIGSLQQGISPMAPLEVAASVQPKEADKAASAGEPATGPVSHADQTNLSAVGGLVSQALGTSDVRTAQVASLQKAISAGQYNVSASDVASKLVETLLDQ
jgi:flagellar biosynthesis anti-sigma factor FlgM